MSDHETIDALRAQNLELKRSLVDAECRARIVEAAIRDEIQQVLEGKHKPLPTKRRTERQKYKVGGHTLYVDVGFYADGQMAEVFLDISKEGAMLRNILHSFAISISLGLQHGIPITTYYEYFKDAGSSHGQGEDLINQIFCGIREILEAQQSNVA